MEKNNLLIFTFLFMIIMLTSSSYFEFQLMRLPSNDHKINIDPIACQNESTINQDAQYKQICYEKDIAYVTNFMSNQQVYYISFDLTTPLSWIKSPSCVIQGTAYKCARKQQTFSHKFKEIKNNIVKKFHKKNKQDDKVNQDTIIQGASQIVRGKLQLSKSIHFYTRDSKVLNNFLDLIMLGLYLRGQKEHLLLQSTNFINATSISSNLNKLNDGAISMRFDSTSQNSFLNEIFSYVKARQKTICIYLGKNQSITIGDMTAKYTLSGYSSINWINMSDDQGFGKWPHINRIGLQDISQDSQNQSQYTIPAIFTLSSSYIGIPDNIINQVLIKSFKNLANCSINSKSLYLQCSYKNKKNGQKLTEKQLFFAFSQKNLMIPFSQLILSNSHNKLVFNIKKTYINKIILGQPIFKHYVLIFDYSKYQIGFGPKRQNFNEFFINVVSLIRFLCFIFVLGCSFIVCYEPCRKMSNVFLNYRKNGRGAEGLGLRQYKPIDENPYDEINKQVNDALQSTQKQVQGL